MSNKKKSTKNTADVKINVAKSFTVDVDVGDLSWSFESRADVVNSHSGALEDLKEHQKHVKDYEAAVNVLAQTIAQWPKGVE